MPVEPTPSPVPASSPYRIDTAAAGSARFHSRLEAFTDRFLRHAEGALGEFIDARLALGASSGNEAERTRGEYAVELLTFGILRAEYAALAGQTPPGVRARMRDLWEIRRSEPDRKDWADAERARLFAMLLWSPRHEFFVPADDPILVDWLESTGEFVQEAFRMRPWLDGLRVFWSAEEFASATRELAAWFEEEARRELSEWTDGVESFRSRILGRREEREDLFLITRSERLYHLNLVGAEAMNRAFRPGFSRRRRKVVLVPGCMRARQDSACQALRRGTDISCTHCTGACHVSRLSALGEREGFGVFVVPHASSFTAWLERWRSDGETALVASACPLHLVAGGYEMRSLGLDAQCVFLLFSGCKRHWDPQGTPTEIDTDRLLRLLAEG